MARFPRGTLFEACNLLGNRFASTTSNTRSAESCPVKSPVLYPQRLTWPSIDCCPNFPPMCSNASLDTADLDRRGPHQMRHTFASLLLQDGAPITYVSRQLGHKDASITLRVYAHWLPDASTAKLVDALDVTPPQTPPRRPHAPQGIRITYR